MKDLMYDAETLEQFIARLEKENIINEGNAIIKAKDVEIENLNQLVISTLSLYQ